MPKRSMSLELHAPQMIPDAPIGAPDTLLYDRLAEDIARQGYSVQPNALPDELSHALLMHCHQLQSTQFEEAGTGRGQAYLRNEFVRKDEICWIHGDSDAGRQWLQWCEQLRQALNQALFLGLFSFESHFAHYRPGDFYKRHVDAFKGQANRMLSVVVYLNPGWTQNCGGELVVYQNEQDQTGLKVTPLMGTIVAFLSEDFPHEVLPAARDRYSIAGWYRVNGSSMDRADPPR